MVTLPAFADLHVHLREPGQTWKETIRSGSLAAARGGYSLVCAMPNLDPVPDCPEHLAVEEAAIARDAVVRVLPYGAITRGRQGKELVDFAALKGRCVAFSDDGSGVQRREMMREAMQEAARQDVILAAHCEDNSLLRGGYIHDGRYCAAHGHKGICSESEWGQIARDVELAAETGCRYHVCHISTRESVEIIRQAKQSGVRVSCETGPHYLTLCEDDLQEDGRFKMNPPLRSADDREALLEGLADGTIDVVATDHAPHSAEEKSRGLQGSAMGIVGLETAFPCCTPGWSEPASSPWNAWWKCSPPPRAAFSACRNPRTTASPLTWTPRSPSIAPTSFPWARPRPSRAGRCTAASFRQHSTVISYIQRNHDQTQEKTCPGKRTGVLR